jgi:hypothetical protein
MSKQTNKILKKVQNFLNEQFDIIDKKTIKRSRKIKTKDIFFTLLQMVQNHLSYSEANCRTKISQDIDFSPQAINTKIINGNYSKHFKELNQTLIQFFYSQTHRTKRIMAVDGSKVRMDKSLNKNGFILMRNKKTTQGLISTIFDVDQLIPLKYDLTFNLNEREICFDQIKNLQKQPDQDKDLLIFDRGYYSLDLMTKMFDLNNDFLFRIKKNLKIVNVLNTVDDLIIEISGRKVRIFQYKIRNKNKKIVRFVKDIDHSKPPKAFLDDKITSYYLLTSLLDQTQYPIEKLKELYHQRWSIEENYKKIKGQLNFGQYHSKKLEGIECEICVQQFIIILTQLLISSLPPPKNPNKKTNYQIISSGIVDNIIPMIMYDKRFKVEKALKILRIVSSYLITSKPGRSFPREVRFSRDKHYYAYNDHSFG